MKKIFFLLIVLSLASVSMAQKINGSAKPNNPVPSVLSAIGFNCGTTTGIGMSYLYKQDGITSQFTFLPLIDSDKSTVSAGVNFSFTLKHDRRSDFVIYLGNHISNVFSENYNYNIGVGPGFQQVNENTLIQFMLGYGIYSINNDPKVRPTIEFGVFYNFAD